MDAFTGEALDHNRLKSIELGYAQELLRAAQTGKPPSPDAIAYKEARDEAEQRRPFLRIEQYVHWMIDGMEDGSISPDNARTFFDEMIEASTDAYFAQKHREELERKLRRE